VEGFEGLTESSESNTDAPWFAEYADSLCAYYMFIGVSFYEYWFGDYSQFHFYEDAYKLRERHENTGRWIQGKYVYDAVGALSPILHPFAKGGTKAEPYLKDPYPISAEEAEERRVRDERQKYEEMKQETIRRMERINARFKPEGGGENE
jgi:hypothetical protein